MIVISYASTRHDSQWSLRGAGTDSMKIARAKSAISRAVGGQQNPDGGRASPRPLAIFAAIFVASGFIYSFHLGTDALGASEAFSAWSAAKPGIGAIARTPILHEPGRFLFYYAALHYYTQIFGLSEVSLRSMSVVLSLATLVLVFALGCEMFDDNTALAAAAMWAFNPLAVTFAHTARMYPMILTLALAQLLMLWRIRQRPSVSIATLCGIAGAALLYTHLGGILFIGAGLAMLVRDYFRAKRNPMAWLAMAITLALFVPYAPVLRAQSETMISGHWLDWIGTAYEYPLWIKVAAALGAAASRGPVCIRREPEIRSRRHDPLARRVDNSAGTRAGCGLDRSSSDVQPEVRCAVVGDARIAVSGRSRASEREMAQSDGGRFRADVFDRAAVRSDARRSHGERLLRKWRRKADLPSRFFLNQGSFRLTTRRASPTADSRLASTRFRSITTSVEIIRG